MRAKLARRSRGRDNQEVGSEAATLERVRNSSLVESGGADNGSRIKPATDAMDLALTGAGSPAWRGGEMVGERRIRRGSRSGSSGGGDASADAGMSSDNRRENRRRRKPEGS